MSLPTGYGKSLCYTLLPRFFDFVRGAKNKSIVVVVSPSLMKDQVSTITKMGLSAANGSHSKASELMSCSCPLNPLIILDNLSSHFLVFFLSCHI